MKEDLKPFVLFLVYALPFCLIMTALENADVKNMREYVVGTLRSGEYMLPSVVIRLIYATEYRLPSQKVTIDKKPHDCEYNAAPYGNKYCHYEVTILSSILKKTGSEGKPIYSYDNGKTWFPSEYSVEPNMSLGWTKIED